MLSCLQIKIPLLPREKMLVHFRGIISVLQVIYSLVQFI